MESSLNDPLISQQPAANQIDQNCTPPHDDSAERTELLRWFLKRANAGAGQGFRLKLRQAMRWKQRHQKPSATRFGIEVQRREAYAEFIQN
jgi:hypothetical protein